MKIGYSIEYEVKLCEGLLDLDIVATSTSGTRLAIEVDGPMHFLSNIRDSKSQYIRGPPNGNTLIRNRILNKQRLKQEGFSGSLIFIPCYEWPESTGENSQISYLKSLIDSALA